MLMVEADRQRGFLSELRHASIAMLVAENPWYEVPSGDGHGGGKT